jgi:AcrR family transcriptional regulator
MPKSTFFNIDQFKRERIIENAIKEFANNHYDKASINKIIKESDIAKGSFYQYFENKQDLYNYLIDLIREKKLEYVTNTMIKPQEYSFFEVLADMNKVAVKFAKTNESLQKITNRLTQDREHFIYKEILARNRSSAIGGYKDLIKLGIKRGEIKESININLTANIIYALNKDFVEYCLEMNDQVELDDLIISFIEMLKSGIVKE